jgi:urea transporter
MGCVGVLSATATAQLLKLDRHQLRNGILGYNGLLVGVAIATLGAARNGEWNLLWLLAALLFSALTTGLMQTVGNWLSRQLSFPLLTLPFIVATLLFWAVAIWMPHPALHAVSFPTPNDQPVDWLRLAASLPIGFGQVFFMDQFISGVLVLLAVVLATPIGAGIGLLGGCMGLLTGLVLHSPVETIYAGLWNYNAILTAIALAGIFYAPTLRSLLVGGCGAALAALVGGLLTLWFQPIQLPVLTLPFCFVTIAALIGLRHSFPALVPIAFGAIATPEQHRQRYLVVKENIMTFRRHLQAAIRGIPRHFLFETASAATKGDLMYLFNAIDRDFDRTLSVAELTAHLRQIKHNVNDQVPGEELAYLFRALKIDCKGTLEFVEFGEVMLRQQHFFTHYKELMTYFSPISTHADHVMSIDKINVVMYSVGEPPLSAQEIRFLRSQVKGTPITWNRFVEMVLLT